MSTQTLKPGSGTTKYYVNCRGMNYLPPMETEWKHSGYFPRLGPNFFGAAFSSVYGVLPNGSDAFLGTNKTSQWRYYNHDDNEKYIRYLREIGINSIRTFTNIYVWAWNSTHFLDAIDDFLSICDKHKMRVQLVLWDGIWVGSEFGGTYWPEPTTSSMTVSSLEFCLYQNWPRIPHLSMEDISTSEGSNFYQNSAVPFVTQLCQTVSSHQSFWSFDVMNEGAGAGSSGLVSATAAYISSILPSVGITMGYAGGLNPFSAVLTNGRGTGPGGVYSVYASDPYTHLPVFNFASVHAYQNNGIARRGFVTNGVSASLQIGIPLMSNETVTPGIGQLYENDASAFNSLNFGSMAFDAFNDRAIGIEPFMTTQGVFFQDGEIRDLGAISGYYSIAQNSNWFSPKQLRMNQKVKGITEDGGLDGGYCSSILPEHTTFDGDLYVSTTNTMWSFFKLLYYTVQRTGTETSYKYNNMSMNYSPYQGHPMDQDAPNYSYVNSKTDFSGFINILYNWSSVFTPLSSYGDVSSGSVWRQRDIELYRRDKVLYNLVISLGEQLIYWSELSGSQYDRSIIPTSAQLAWSGAYYPFSRTDGSSIKIAAGASYYLSSQAPCVLTNTCLYNTPGVPSSGIDWDAYDAAYNNCVDALKDVFDVLLDAGVSDDRYRLYP